MSVENVLATETLEHVSRPVRFLAEARRCLSPGGRLMLTVPFAARWHYIPHDYWRFTPSGLRQLLTDAGFNILLSMETYKWYYHLISAQRAGATHSTPYKVAGPLCDDVVISARVLGQTDRSPIKREMGFRCGE